MTTFLVDMDDTIASWQEGYDTSLDSHGEPAALIPRRADRLQWDLRHGRSRTEKQIIELVMQESGFYAKLRPIPGAKAALKNAVKEGHDVRIVTAPYISNPTCASDKIAWVARHYGSRWASRVVMTNDKTVVRGDFLIDDKPVITGAMEPEWRHVLFDQPYNRDAAQSRIHEWSPDTLLMLAEFREARR